MDPIRSLSEQAYQQIRSRIIANVWPTGHQALEQAIALELGMSRTPVREALIRLEKEGLVEVVPRHGMRVLPVSANDMREIYEILTALESMAAELTAQRKPSKAELAPLEQASRDMEAALTRNNLDAWADADSRFHRHLLDLCGNRMLADAVMRYWDRSHRVRMITLRMRPPPVNSTREHREIVARIRDGDARGAHALYREHRQRASRELLGVLERFGLHQL
jgi:DNA-binding GntR family transcriptional regulator